VGIDARCADLLELAEIQLGDVHVESVVAGRLALGGSGAGAAGGEPAEQDDDG
jgi:hypothetical protein